METLFGTKKGRLKMKLKLKAQCCVPEPEIVGVCAACSGAMYGYELEFCECGCIVHAGCKVECDYCGDEGCKACMEYSPDAGTYKCKVCGGNQNENRIKQPESLKLQRPEIL